MSFVTVQELRNYPLPLTEAQWAKIDANADQVAVVLDYATQHIRDYLEKDVDLIEYVERFEGNGRNRLMLDNYPVTEIDSVVSTDIFGNEVPYDSSAFMIDNAAGIITWVDRYRNTFFRERLWTVTYTAGYAVTPGPIKHATALQAIQMLQPIFRGGTNFSQTTLIEDINEEIVDMLDKYKRDRIG